MRSMHEASKARRMALLRKAGAVAQVVVPGSFVVGGFLAENKYVIATGALVAALEAWPKLRKIAKARATRRRHEEMMNDPSNYV